MILEKRIDKEFLLENLQASSVDTSIKAIKKVSNGQYNCCREGFTAHFVLGLNDAVPD